LRDVDRARSRQHQAGRAGAYLNTSEFFGAEVIPDKNR